MNRLSILFIMTIVLSMLVVTTNAGTYSGGSGTEADPYQISTVADWQELMTTSADGNKSFILTADLDMDGLILTPVGNLGITFTGDFDGQSHCIHNAEINQPTTDFISLFGQIGSGGCVRNLGVVDCNFYGRSYVGGLVGANDRGTITSCYATGTVKSTGVWLGVAPLSHAGGLVGVSSGGNISDSYATCRVNGEFRYVGGLVGVTMRGVTISGCYATGDVNGIVGEVGGLVGRNDESVISDCYARGAVSSTRTVGGLLGRNEQGTVIRCYSTGAVSGDSANHQVGGFCGASWLGIISGCFWDVETSGMTDSSGGIGKTTTEMMTLSTFTNAGWDFLGESINGTADIWRMLYEGYPIISWQNLLAVKSPNGGEYLLNSSIYTILWATEFMVDVDSVKLEFSPDNGETWETIDLLENTGSFDWTVPDLESDECLIRISDAQNLNTSDVSDEPFTIISTIGGYIDWGDFLIFLSRWLDTNCSEDNWCDLADINRDDNVNFMDFSWLGLYLHTFAPVPGEAVDPIPQNMADNVSMTADLSWTVGSDTVAHGVYFGTNASPDVNDFQGYQLNTSFDPGTLSPATTYYWCIDEVGLGGTTAGQVWNFTTIFDPTLMGWWQFDETSGNVAHDSSGNENNGLLVDGVGEGLVWMPEEDALNFDGTNNLSRVVIPTTGMTTSAGTIAMWANLAEPQMRDDGRNGQGYFLGCDNGGNSEILIYMDNYDTGLDVKVGNRSANNIITLSTETWYHVVLTWDSGFYTVSVNGLRLTDGTYVGISSLPSTTDIGNNGGTGTQSFHGLMGDVRLFNRSLSSTEIQQLYEEGALALLRRKS